MDMNKAFFLKKEDSKPEWQMIDAQGKVLGRLATEIADALRGKNKVTYTKHTDGGDYIVVINADKVVLTGNKWDQKTYERYSGWRGGLKTMTAQEMLDKHPTEIITHAVKGMLPKNTISRAMLKKLKVYTGTQHPHIAQLKSA